MGESLESLPIEFLMEFLVTVSESMEIFVIITGGFFRRINEAVSEGDFVSFQEKFPGGSMVEKLDEH